jgi:hypothetical protein
LELNNDTSIDLELIGGLSLIERAISGANWGKEKSAPEVKEIVKQE